MVIASGALHQKQWSTTSIGDDTLIAVSDTGYSNDVLVSNESSTLNGPQQRASTLNGAFFYSTVMARTA